MKAIILFIVMSGFSLSGFCQSNIDPKAKEHVYNGIKLEQKGDYEGALEEYTKAIQIDGEYADAYYYRGMLMLQHGDDTVKPYGCSDLQTAINYGYPASSMYYNYCNE